MAGRRGVAGRRARRLADRPLVRRRGLQPRARARGADRRGRRRPHPAAPHPVRGRGRARRSRSRSPRCSPRPASSRSGRSRCSRSCSGWPTGSSTRRTRRGCRRSSRRGSCSRRTASRACCGPTIMQAAGPALASLLIAVQAPWLAFAVVAVLQVVAAVVLAVMRTTPVRRDPDEVVAHPLRQSFIDLRDGFAYLLRTRWLFATLLFAIMLVLVIMGPIEVLLPFAVKDQTGGGAGAFALALAAFGVGRRGGLARRRVAPDATPVPHAHDPGVGRRMRAARGHRPHVMAVGHGGGAVHRRRAVLRRAGASGARSCSGGSRRRCWAGCRASTSSCRSRSCRSRWRSPVPSARRSGSRRRSSSRVSCRRCSRSRRSRSPGSAPTSWRIRSTDILDAATVTGAEAAAGFELPVDEEHRSPSASEPPTPSRADASSTSSVSRLDQRWPGATRGERQKGSGDGHDSGCIHRLQRRRHRCRARVLRHGARPAVEDAPVRVASRCGCHRDRACSSIRRANHVPASSRC